VADVGAIGVGMKPGVEGGPPNSNRRRVRRSCRRLGLLLAVVIAAVFASGEGQAEVLCVTDVEPNGGVSCAGASCDGIYGTVAEALLWAEGLPDQNGQRPEVGICMGAELPDSGAPHVETLVVDNRGGRYGEPLKLHLGRPLCPDPTSSPSQPLVEFVADGEGWLTGPTSEMLDGGPCESGPRPGVSIWGGGEIMIGGVSLSGWDGFGVANGLVGPGVTMQVLGGSLRNGRGTALRSSRAIEVWQVEFAGNRTNGAPALVWLEAGSERLRITGSAFYANVVDGMSSEALVMASPAAIDSTAFIANGAVDRQPLVSTGPVVPDYDNAPGSSAFGGLQNVVFARNRALAYPPFDSLVHPPAEEVEGSEIQCDAIPAEPYRLREEPFVTIPVGEVGPLVRADFDQGEEIWGDEVGLIFGARNTVVRNDAGMFLEADLSGHPVDVELIHNTIADNGNGAVLELTGAEATSVILARNLYVGSTAGGLAVIDPPPSTLVSTMNASETSVTWVEPPQGVDHLLAGPDLHFDAPEWEYAGSLWVLTPCQRFAAVCPDIDESDCSSWNGQSHECAPDLAAEYFPTRTMLEQISVAWPWQTTWLGGPAEDIAGATGWRCHALTATYDSWDHRGDGDGYPDAIDCENENEDVIPALPEHDGLSSPWCDASEVDCYLCPEDSESPPEDDDDDSSETEGAGCVGCGFPWSWEDGILLVLPLAVGLPWFRRSRGTSESLE